jgi:hypothetical protein
VTRTQPHPTKQSHTFREPTLNLTTPTPHTQKTCITCPYDENTNATNTFNTNTNTTNTIATNIYIRDSHESNTLPPTQDATNQHTYTKTELLIHMQNQQYNNKNTINIQTNKIKTKHILSYNNIINPQPKQSNNKKHKTTHISVHNSKFRLQRCHAAGGSGEPFSAAGNPSGGSGEPFSDGWEGAEVPVNHFRPNPASLSKPKNQQLRIRNKKAQSKTIYIEKRKKHTT